jgi:DNA (cytosine-5)-methyltransferase 1
MKKLKVLDLFSGIGGFALGLDSTGIFETVKFVEKDKYCQKVLQKNFPNIPIEEDIKNVEGKEGDADVVVGGFPCQPMSVAGKRKGTDDDRYLWPEMFRLIKQIKPQFVIGENVQGIINIQNGMVLRQVQDDLESEGFEVQCFLIPASGIGAWHQRYRVWIVGHSEHNGSLTSKIERGNTETATGTQEGTNTTGEPERTSRSRNNEDVSNTEIIGTRESRNIDQEEGNQSSSSTQFNSSSEDVSNTDSGMRRGWRTIGESGEDKVWRFYSEEEEQTRVDIRSETIGRDAVSGEETNALQSNDERREERNVSDQSEEQNFSSGRHDTDGQEQTWWQIESNVRGVPNGISYGLDKDRANRIKTLGNAIVPQIAREIGLAIKKVL